MGCRYFLNRRDVVVGASLNRTRSRKAPEAFLGTRSRKAPRSFLLKLKASPELSCKSITEKMDKVDSSGFSISSAYSILLLYRRPQSSKEAAKKDACSKSCKELHELGALKDHLLPNEETPASTDSDNCKELADEGSRAELHEMLVPASLKESWNDFNGHVHLSSYYLKFTPIPTDRVYKRFGLFVKVPLPEEAERMELDLHLSHGRSVKTELVPSGVVKFDKDEILQAQKFQEMFLKVILERTELVCDFVSLGKKNIHHSTFYLLLPVILHDCENTLTVDWTIIGRSLSSPIFRTPADSVDNRILNMDKHLQLANGPWSVNDVEDSLVYVPYKKAFFFVSRILYDKDGNSRFKKSTSHVQHFQKLQIHLSYPGQPLLKLKQLSSLKNLLLDRKKGNSEPRELEQHFLEIPAELCELKIIAFSKDIGSSVSLLPSIMHRLENFLVAIELKRMLSASFPEGAEVTAHHVLEALTTEKCNERFSLERLEVLGDAFLKFAVGRCLFLLHQDLGEGELTKKRSNQVKNSNLYKLATMKRIQVYIRDHPCDPCQFYALGRPCPVICNDESERSVHSQSKSMIANCADVSDVRCSKCHHWLYKDTIADVVEALIGAFLVDSGFKAATAFLRWIGIQVEFEASQVTDICLASASYEPLAAYMDVAGLENLLGYPFQHRGLLLQAFVHPSYRKHGGGSYQRLEYLGDAVIDYLITSYLYSVYPELKPGQLTDLRSLFVNNEAFANIAACKSFHKFLISDSSCLSEAVEKYADFINTDASQESMLEGPKCPKVLGDLVESSFGAILLDTGFDLNQVWRIMLSFFDPIMSFSTFQPSPIRELQELRQYYNWNLQHSTSKEGNFFSIEAKVSGKDFCAIACATNLNKKDAIKIAAQKLCVELKAQGFVPKSKSLEEDLKSCRKMEAKLIGYDETPIDVIFLEAIKVDNLKVLDPSGSSLNPTTYTMEEAPNNSFPPCIRRIWEKIQQLHVKLLQGS